MELKETPGKMVEGGEIAGYGAFKNPFRDVNIKDAKISVLSREMPLAYSRARLKEWQHIGIIGDDFYFGFAIVDAKYMGNSFCYFLDRSEGKMVEYGRIAPPGIARVARDLWHGECRFNFAGYRIEIDNRLEYDHHRARVCIDGSSGKPGIEASIVISEDLNRIQPLILMTPLRGGRPAYTHKVACPASGEIRLGSKHFTFGEDSGIALIDEQKTFFPYRTFWRWATCAGHDSKGRIVALNMSKGISIDEEEYNDNVLWVDGVISFLGVSRFEFNEDDVLEPWHIGTGGDSCVLDFQPEGERWGNINFLVLVSNFHQPYGSFRGVAFDSGGGEHKIRDYFGVTEHHLARF